MSSFFESVQNLNAVKEERAHSRIAVPKAHQVDENYRLFAEILDGSLIEQAEVAGVAIDVGSSAAEQILRADHLSREDLIGVLAGIWVDGVVQVVNFFKQWEASKAVPEPADDEAGEGE